MFAIGWPSFPGYKAHRRLLSLPQVLMSNLCAMVFSLSAAPDLPEALTEGKEGLYIKSFYDRLVSRVTFRPHLTIEFRSVC
jgi:hypothetical protein